MPLVKCPDCGNNVSDRADACPVCGCPQKFFSEQSDTPQEQPASQEIQVIQEQPAQQPQQPQQPQEAQESQPKPHVVKYLPRNTTVGGIVALGRWGGEDIAWRVLAKEGERVLLLAERGLDCQPFNITPSEGNDWSRSYLKGWLEDVFGPEAGLPGSPFCLSIDEAKKYFKKDEDRVCRPTDHAIEQGVLVDKDRGTSYWWLRSPGELDNVASLVCICGIILVYRGKVSSENCAVRPALWVDLQPKA